MFHSKDLEIKPVRSFMARWDIKVSLEKIRHKIYFMWLLITVDSTLHAKYFILLRLESTNNFTKPNPYKNEYFLNHLM